MSNSQQASCVVAKAVVVAGATLFAAITGAQSIDDELDALADEIAGTGNSESARAPATGDLEQALLTIGGTLAPSLSIDEIEPRVTAKRLGGGKVSGRLLALAEHRSKSIGDQANQAKGLGIPYDDGLVSVRLTAESEGDVSRLTREVRAEGGEVVATFENVVFARLPVNGIEPLADLDALYFADAQATSRPLRTPGYGDLVSEGVAMLNVDRLHRAGVTGRSVRVGIVDWGFDGYDALVAAGELPRARASRAFGRAGRVQGVGSVHGTGCAEIIADMAPDAELFLAQMDGPEGQIVAAAQWLASQGVDIINFSGGGHFGPHNGTALLDRFVDYLVREHDVLWVNAAGNEGASHWTGLARDRNGNGFVDSVNSRYPDLIALSGEQLRVTVVWDDWGSDPQRPTSNQDIDAYLLAQGPRGLTPVAASRVVQAGRDKPAEMLQIGGIPDGEVLYLALHMKRVGRPVRTHVFVEGVHDGGSMAPIVDSHSVGIPATARSALAVAAIDVRNGRLEPYSSRGPTDDNRSKPDVSAPDNTASLAYARDGRIGRFTGTSAAAPHVAGFAALLKQIDRSAGAARLRQAVESHVSAIGGSPNTRYGRGLIDGGKVRLAGAGQDRSNNDNPNDGELADDELERALLDILQDQGG